MWDSPFNRPRPLVLNLSPPKPALSRAQLLSTKVAIGDVHCKLQPAISPKSHLRFKFDLIGSARLSMQSRPYGRVPHIHSSRTSGKSATAHRPAPPAAVVVAVAGAVKQRDSPVGARRGRAARGRAPVRRVPAPGLR